MNTYKKLGISPEFLSKYSNLGINSDILSGVNSLINDKKIERNDDEKGR